LCIINRGNSHKTKVMIDKQQQVTINLNEYVTYEQKVEVVEGLMELLDLQYDREDQIITLKRDNEDILQLAIEKYERLYKK
jgi:hypothetical protein